MLCKKHEKGAYTTAWELKMKAASRRSMGCSNSHSEQKLVS